MTWSPRCASCSAVSSLMRLAAPVTSTHAGASAFTRRLIGRRVEPMHPGSRGSAPVLGTASFDVAERPRCSCSAGSERGSQGRWLLRRRHDRRPAARALSSKRRGRRMFVPSTRRLARPVDPGPVEDASRCPVHDGLPGAVRTREGHDLPSRTRSPKPAGRASAAGPRLCLHPRGRTDAEQVQTSASHRRY
jgi:hypothetical protein